MSPLIKKLVVTLAAVVCAVGAGEVGTRLVARLRGEPYSAARTRAGLERNLAAAEGRLVPGAAQADDAPEQLFIHPYYAWDARPNHQRLENLITGFREHKLENDYAIVIVGGSVAGLFADSAVGAPDVLAAAIGADPRLAGRRVRVFSQARGAFKQPQQLYVVSWMLSLGVVPDAVINIDGFNELAIAAQNLTLGVHPLYPSFPQWGPRLRASGALADPELVDREANARRDARDAAATGLARHLEWSAVLGPWALSRSTAALERWKSASTQLLASSFEKGSGPRGGLLGPEFGGDETAALDLSIAAWRNASQDIETLCRRRGIEYLHVLQPTLHDRGSKPLTPEEKRDGTAIPPWVRAVRYGYDKLRVEGARLRSEGFPFFDASMVFADVDSTLYYDPCHFSKDGNRLLAEAVSGAFRELVLGR